MTQNLSCEVVVVGAGSAGSAVAARLAAAGRDVILTDQRPRQEAGAGWINAIPGWCFDKAGLARPEPPEATRPAGRHTAILMNDEGTTRIAIPADPGVMTDMSLLTARLQKKATEHGARILHGRVVAVLQDRRVRGVALVQDETERSIHARLTVDASGLAGAVRSQTRGLAIHCPPSLPRDLCLAAQYQYRVADPAAASAFLARNQARPGDGIATLGVAGGYSILQVCVSSDLREVGLLGGAIPADGHGTGGALLERYRARNPWIGEPLRGGQGAIPLGRPYDHLTAPGVALIGDAARQIYGIHGSGVGMHLLAARHLAEAVEGAPDPGDPQWLHRYAAGYQRRYGGRLAGADQFRRLSQSLPGRKIGHILASGLLTPDVLAPGLLQSPLSLDLRTVGSLCGPGMKHPALLLGLLPTAARMALLEPLYRTYPRVPDERAVSRFSRRIRRVALG